ncbi:RHS repeat-associated core domain-containing protein [uncultured Winogradskyella sp.]|uniref:RHS repeat-associated core domain-containing protein n=1 Tax=uncultured Winogradskyella sp. TaxID=395353 RepID=UPI0026109412|nr:RHS repeat-associated core domain-containing protein [uncultured Winogradskyella sp.]
MGSYYPFGLKHKGYNDVVSANVNSVASKFKYNGKELNDELGLDWYDYGARNYDSSLGRWMNLDPLAENYYYDSPYIYTTNNPVLFIDPDGRYWKRSVGDDGKVTYTAQEGDSAWSLHQQYGESDGISAEQANSLVESQIAKNYIRESDGMLMSNVEIGNTVEIGGNDDSGPVPVDPSLAGNPDRLPVGGGMTIWGEGGNNSLGGMDSSQSGSGGSMDALGSPKSNKIVKALQRVGLMTKPDEQIRREMRGGEMPSISSDELNMSLDTLFRPTWNTNLGTFYEDATGGRQLDSTINARESYFNSNNISVNSFRVDTMNSNTINTVHRRVKKFKSNN